MMLRAVLLVSCLVMSTAGAAENPARPLTAPEKAAIKRGFEGELLDPDSAQFRLGLDHPTALTGWKDKKYCGLVNAKNAYGGYTGYKVFTIFVERDAKGRIVRASFPDIAEAGMFLRANIRMCKDAGYAIEY